MSQPTQIVKITRTFAASAERVFDAWLDPKTTGRWLFSTSAGKVVRIEIDAKVGGRYVIVDRREVGDVEHTGEYLEIDRPKRLVFTLVVPMYSSASTRVSIEIVPLSTSSCELTLTHEGVHQENAPQTQNGWAMILDGLQSSIDGLTTLRITRLFNAQPSRVFDAWTDPKVASKWLFTAPTSERHEMQAELRVGGKWTVIDRRQGVDYTALGEYLELDRPRRLVFTFGMPQFSAGFAKVTVEMRPEGDGTLMTLTHEKLPWSAVSETEKGWSAMLDCLPAFL